MKFYAIAALLVVSTDALKVKQMSTSTLPTVSDPNEYAKHMDDEIIEEFKKTSTDKDAHVSFYSKGALWLSSLKSCEACL